MTPTDYSNLIVKLKSLLINPRGSKLAQTMWGVQNVGSLLLGGLYQIAHSKVASNLGVPPVFENFHVYNLLYRNQQSSLYGYLNRQEKRIDSSSRETPENTVYVCVCVRAREQNLLSVYSSSCYTVTPGSKDISDSPWNEAASCSIMAFARWQSMW